ncbi:hypothetical protein TPA0906_00080 [Streptomyces olivaceus]|uniref:hypothetical protein n=1 Tax=Streptomyces olivaceus TaxID=47716 RepID=UPI0022EE90A2|nr:hypothetical protein [Streptomyces olivaceus]GHI98142.1 hypothetical protein TPA0906_00080 [Streptomyces olivaceus]
MTSETSSTAPAAPQWPYTPGDTVFVYDGGPGLITRVEGWALSLLESVMGDGPETTLKRMVVAFRNVAGHLDISSPLCVAPLEAAAAAWHLVAPDGRIVGGGTRRQGREPSLTRDELEALRDTGTYGKSLVGSVAVDGLPDGVQRAPSAGATDPVTAPSDGTFPAAHGGVYLWHVPTL